MGSLYIGTEGEIKEKELEENINTWVFEGEGHKNDLEIFDDQLMVKFGGLFFNQIEFLYETKEQLEALSDCT